MGTVNPANIRSALCINIRLRLPMLGLHPRFKKLCKELKLSPMEGPACASDRGPWEISNVEKLGSSEMSQLLIVAEGCRKLIELEARFEAGEHVNLDSVVNS